MNEPQLTTPPISPLKPSAEEGLVKAILFILLCKKYWEASSCFMENRFISSDQRNSRCFLWNALVSSLI